MNDTYPTFCIGTMYFIIKTGTQKGESSLVLSFFFKFFNDGWLIMYSR